MADLHRVTLSLGSNIKAEENIPKAVKLLRDVGKIESVSSVWESKSVGFDGPNFLNACLIFLTSIDVKRFKGEVIRPIETKIGRVRNADKNASRTIDIDLLLYDETPLNTDFWEYAFVIVPLAELLPDFVHPSKREKLSQVSEQIKSQIWIELRPDVTILDL